MEMQDQQSRGNAQEETVIDLNKKRELFSILDYISPTPLPQNHDILQRDFQPPQTIHGLIGHDHQLLPSLDWAREMHIPLAWAASNGRKRSSRDIDRFLSKDRRLRKTSDLFPYLVGQFTNANGTQRIWYPIISATNGNESYYIETRMAYNGNPDTFINNQIPDQIPLIMVQQMLFVGMHLKVLIIMLYLMDGICMNL